MAAIVRFDLPASPGINNRTRSDVQVGDTVTITNVTPGASNIFLLYGSPAASSAVLVGVGIGSRTLVVDEPGTYRVYLEVDGLVVIHTFKVLTENLLLDIPSHNEDANETANKTNIATNPEFIEESESNEGDDYKGWHPAYERNWLILEREVFKKTGDNSLIFNTGYTPPLFPEGLVFWNGTDHTLNLITGEGPVLQVGQESYLPFTMGCNESGGIIPNGKVVYLSNDGLKITIELANSSDPDIVNKVVGITTQSIADGGCGFVTTYGLVRGVDTSLYSLGDTLYVSPTTDGELQDTRPTNGDFPIPIVTVVEVDALDGVFFVHYLDVQDPDDVNNATGFPFHNQTTPYRMTTISFSDAAPDRTFSIQPTAPETDFYFWQTGKKYIRTGDTIQIPNSIGLYVFYYDQGVLSYIQDPTNAELSTAIREYVLISYVYWDGTEHNYLGNERHGFDMSGDTHAYLHFTRGAQWVNGLALNNLSVDDIIPIDASAQFGVEFGVTNDEDIILISSGTLSTVGLPIFYLDGANATMKRTHESGFSVLTDITAGVDTTGRLVWNEYTGTTWQLTVLTNNDFVLCHIFGTNDILQPTIAIIGQDEYGTVGQARTGAQIEIASILSQFPQEELVPLATVIFQTSNIYSNTVKARVRSTDEGDNYVDWRQSELQPGAAPTDHGNLAGLGNDDHTQYLLTDGTRSADTLKIENSDPSLDFVDTDETTPSGKFRLQSESDLLKIKGRNSGDSAFEDILEAERVADGGRVAIGEILQTDTKLSVGGTDGAFKPPRLTTTQRNVLTPSAGMVIYNTTTNALEHYNGSSWVSGGGGSGPTTPGTTVIGDLPAWGDVAGASLVNAIPLRAGFGVATGQTYRYSYGSRDLVLLSALSNLDTGFALLRPEITNTDISFDNATSTITFGSDNPSRKFGVGFPINVVTTSGVNDGNYTIASFTSSTVVVTGTLTTETAAAAGTVTVRHNVYTRLTVPEDGYYAVGYNIFGAYSTAAGTLISGFTNAIYKNGVGIGPTSTVMSLDGTDPAKTQNSRGVGISKQYLTTTDELSLNIKGTTGDSTMYVSISSNFSYLFAMRLL